MIDLCEECGGSCIEPDGSECQTCQGFGTLLVTDEGPEDSIPDPDVEDHDPQM